MVRGGVPKRLQRRHGMGGQYYCPKLVRGGSPRKKFETNAYEKTAILKR